MNGASGTIGYAWTVDGKTVAGHVTVNHLAGAGAVVTTTAALGVPSVSVRTKQTTDAADLSLIGSIGGNVEPSILLSSGNILYVSKYASAGALQQGQQVCHSGWNETTKKLPYVCGTIVAIGATGNCHADGSGSSTCRVLIKGMNGWVGGPGDSGAAAYIANGNGTITLVGNYKGESAGYGVIEPVYAAMQIFGGRPYVSADR